MNKLTIQDLSLKGKRVLVRVDFNVPLKDENGTRVVADDTRIRAALPTIKHILDADGTAILMSHLGRPSGEAKSELSLRPVAAYLSDLLGQEVVFPGALEGDAVTEALNTLASGQVLLLENTRYDDREKKNDSTLAQTLASYGNVYVNDAFGTAHRAHASTAGVTAFVDQSAMGLLLQREAEYLGKVLTAPEHPFVAVLGGAKVSDKIGVIENLLDTVDTLLIGGAMSYTFLKAMGQPVGTSLVEDDKLDVAKDLLERADGKIHVPTDHVVAAAFDNNAEHHATDSIPDGFMGLDIGPATIAAYQEALLNAKMVIWNGPMGVFEMSNFAKGTLAIAETLAKATAQGALTLVGGGDSVAAITQMGYEDQVSHVSTGGGAMLEFLEGKILPGIAALTNKA